MTTGTCGIAEHVTLMLAHMYRVWLVRQSVQNHQKTTKCAKVLLVPINVDALLSISGMMSMLTDGSYNSSSYARSMEHR